MNLKIKYIFLIILLNKINGDIEKKDPVDNHPLFSKPEMGNMVWIVMHLYSSFFPEYPTKLDIEEYQQLIYLLGKHFPCKICSGHFLEMIKDKPIKFNTRGEMMHYLCEIHNVVNERLKKPIFECSKVSDVWGQKDCGCKVNFKKK